MKEEYIKYIKEMIELSETFANREVNDSVTYTKTFFEDQAAGLERAGSKFIELFMSPTITRATKGSSGYDLVAQEDVPYELHPFYVNVGKCPPILEGYFGLLCPRSSMTRKGIIFHGGNHVIDSDYDGDILIALENHWKLKEERDGTHSRDNTNRIFRGDKIAQLVLIPYGTFPGETEPKEERMGGFGSTGR